jgi:hypothetical protein
MINLLFSGMGIAVCAVFTALAAWVLLRRMDEKERAPKHPPSPRW